MNRNPRNPMRAAAVRTRRWRFLRGGLSTFIGYIATVTLLVLVGVGARRTASAMQQTGSLPIGHVGVGATNRSGASSVPKPPVPVYGQLQARSIAANSDDPNMVAAFVDEVFSQTGFREAARSLKTRVVTAELAYRHGKQQPIKVGALVNAVNRAAAPTTLPSYFRTSRSQIALQQLYVHASAPRGLWDREDSPEELAPTEAVFYTLFMTMQKFFARSYQVGPDEWARRQRALMANRPSHEFLQARAKRALNAPYIREYATLLHELSHEGTDVTEAAHELFDRMGIQKSF